MMNSLMKFIWVSLIYKAKSLIFCGQNHTQTVTVYGGGQKKAKKLSPSKIWGVRFACQLLGAQAVVLCQMNLKGISTMLQYHIKYNSKVQL